MLDTRTVRAGQRVTVKYASAVEWGKVTNNPFRDLDVTRAMVVSFTACGADTYSNMCAKLDHEKSGKPSWHCPAPEVGDCVRVHKDKGTIYLTGINHDTVSAQFLIGGIPATNEQTAEIRAWLRPSREVERGLDFRLWTVDKLANATCR